MTEISHLVVNGCSWTYGDELTDPANQAWPALLARKLNLPIVNLAVRGQSNPAIFRRTSEYLFKTSHKSKPFVIIAWSQNFRDEGWFEHLSAYRNLRSPESEKHLHLKEQAYINDFNYEDFFRRSLLNKINMINLLKVLDVPYIIGDYENSDNDFFQYYDKREIKKLFKEMIEYYRLQKNVWKTPLIDYTNKCPKLAGGHEDVEGHQIIFEKIYDFFCEIYSEYKFVEAPYLNNKTFTHTFKEIGIYEKNPWP